LFSTAEYVIQRVRGCRARQRNSYAAYIEQTRRQFGVDEQAQHAVGRPRLDILHAARVARIARGGGEAAGEQVGTYSRAPRSTQSSAARSARVQVAAAARRPETKAA
jgi:hypothetical protein